MVQHLRSHTPDGREGGRHSSKESVLGLCEKEGEL